MTPLYPPTVTQLNLSSAHCFENTVPGDSRAAGRPGYSSPKSGQDYRTMEPGSTSASGISVGGKRLPRWRRDWKDARERRPNGRNFSRMAFRSGHPPGQAMSNGDPDALKPLFTEWLMGWPIRVDRLRACGNGVIH